jgi:hypothetical protein
MFLDSRYSGSRAASRVRQGDHPDALRAAVLQHADPVADNCGVDRILETDDKLRRA